MKQEYEVKRELKRLSTVKGSGTELISVYIPPGFPISEEVAKLRDEHGQASNIKSKTTKLNVQGALEKLMQYLRLYKMPPKNGLAVFCGNISKEQAKPNIELFSMEPPQPIKANIYRCDSAFLLEPIERMLEATDTYGIVVLDGREATIGMLNGTQFKMEKTLRSFAHQKVHKGGQSAARYDRAREESIDDYYKSVGDTINSMFIKYQFKPKGLIVGGPGPTKDNFVKAKVLNYQIKVLGVFDTGYTDEDEGVRELLERAAELLREQAVTQERTVMEKFMAEVARSGLAVSGYEKVMKAMGSNNVAKLIISEDLELYEVHYKCSNCGESITGIEHGNERQSHHSCGGSLNIESQSDAVENLIDMADKHGVDVVFVSSGTQYGRQLLLGFGGVAAMLRYRG